MAETNKEWFKRNSQLLQRDIEDMLWNFPGFTYQIKKQKVTWNGTVKIVTPEGKFINYDLRIECRNNYPNEAPRCYIKEEFPTSGKWRPPHLYNDGSLCLFYPEDEPSRRWTKKEQLSTIVTWCCEWLHVYEYWKRTGGQRWLGRKVTHRRKGK